MAVAVTAQHGQPCDDERSLLFGLGDALFSGPASSEGADYSASLSDLIAAFSVAQRRAAARCDAGAWSDDKVLRKEHWLALGMHRVLMPGTLLTGALAGVGNGSGRFCARDPNCAAHLHQLLKEHQALVLKPTHGVNSSGVLIVSIAAEPLRYVPRANGEPRERPKFHPLLPPGCVWAFSPAGAGVEKAGVESVGCYRSDDWFERLVCADEMSNGVGAERGHFLVEPCLPYHQEVTVLAINGGRVQVLSAKANVMERLLMLDGQPTFVAASDFSPPSCRGHVLPPDSRCRHTAMVLRQSVAGFPEDQKLHEVIRQTVRRISGSLGAAAVRVDFFVRWGSDDGALPATLKLNEVEHGFSPAAMVGWFGTPLTDYAMRAWALGGDCEQQARCRLGTPPPPYGRLPPASVALPFDSWLRAHHTV